MLVDTADGVVAPVGNVQVARRIEGTAIGFANARLVAGPPSPA
jgi:hypothetical protein